MRKILFVLLAALLAAMTGCRSEAPPDAAVSSSLLDSAGTASGTSSVRPAGARVLCRRGRPLQAAAVPHPVSRICGGPGPFQPAGTASREAAASSEQKPPATPEQTNPPESAGSASSAPAPSSTQPAPSPEEETPAPEPEASEQPAPAKSIYDFPSISNKSRRKWYKSGNEMGWAHRVQYQDGTLITPDNSSWGTVVVGNQIYRGNG